MRMLFYRLMHDKISFWFVVEHGVGLQYALHASLSRSEELREAYIVKMKRYAADDLEFLDEAIFYENTK
jgi:hypothetical protein